MDNISKNSKILSWLVWINITLFYCYQYILRIIPNIIMPDIVAKYSVGASEFGSFAGFYYLGYIAVHIPIGLLLSRYGGKKIIPLCIATTAIGLAPLLFSNSWKLVVWGRALTGIGSSAAIVGALQIFRIIYPGHFSKMLGLSVFSGLITVVYIGKPLGLFIEKAGLENTVNILMCCGLGLAVITYLLMPRITDQGAEGNIFTDIKAVLFNPYLIFSGLFAGLMVGPLEGFADAWGSIFMMSAYHLEKSTADYYTLSIYLGMCLGSLVLPYLADLTRFYFGITIASGMLMIAGFCSILSGNITVNILYYTCILIGVCCAYQVVIISKISTFVSPERSGIAGSVTNMIIMGFGWVFHTIIGIRLDSMWDGATSEGIKIYNPAALTGALSIIPVAICVAVIGFMILVYIRQVKARLLKRML